MRLHKSALLTEGALTDLETASGGGILFDRDMVPVEPTLLWLLLQTYRDHHKIYKPGAMPPSE